MVNTVYCSVPGSRVVLQRICPEKTETCAGFGQNFSAFTCLLDVNIDHEGLKIENLRIRFSL